MRQPLYKGKLHSQGKARVLYTAEWCANDDLSCESHGFGCALRKRSEIALRTTLAMGATTTNAGMQQNIDTYTRSAAVKPQ